VVAHAVLSIPEDGCKEHPKYLEKSCSEIKYRLQTAASRWKPIYIRLARHGTMNVKLASVLVRFNDYLNFLDTFSRNIQISYFFFENPSSGRRVLPCGQTDGHT
jgi:hypothetical protein